MASLTKRRLAVQISKETGLAQHQVVDIIQRTLDHITNTLAKGDNVELRNFGVLEVRLTKPRVGRNPNEPGSNFVIPARATVKFKAGKIMRQLVLKRSASMQAEAAKKATAPAKNTKATRKTPAKTEASTAPPAKKPARKKVLS